MKAIRIRYTTVFSRKKVHARTVPVRGDFDQAVTDLHQRLFELRASVIEWTVIDDYPDVQEVHAAWVALYVVDQQSIPQIARASSAPQSVVRRALLRMGVTLRDRRTASQLASVQGRNGRPKGTTKHGK